MKMKIQVMIEFYGTDNVVVEEATCLHRDIERAIAGIYWLDLI